MGYLHGGRVVAKALAAENVKCLFTLCGGHIQSIYDGCIDEGIRVVDTRHEQSAAHAADGWSRVTGEVGVAAVTAGPGVTDAVTAVANAQRAGVPMVLIGGAGPRLFKDMGSLQDMDHVKLMSSICKWSTTVPNKERLAEYIASAFRAARSGVPGPVFVEMPLDLLMDMVDEDQTVYPVKYRTEARPAGDPEYLDAAAKILAEAERPMLIVGSQIRWSKDAGALARFLEQFPTPAFVNGMARGSLPPGHPCLFTRVRKNALHKTDALLIFGTPFDFRLNYGRADALNAGAKVIQVDLDGGEIGRNRGVDVGIVGDTGLVLEGLRQRLEKLGRKDRSGWLGAMAAAEAKKVDQVKPEMESDANPINPLRLCAELNKFVDEDTFVIGDGGDFVATAAYTLKISKPFHWLDPGPLGTLGVGPGYAMAAKLAFPNSRVLIVYGDGSFGLNGFEFEAMARQGIKVDSVIGNDAGWTQIRRGQVAMFGEERAVATKLEYTRYDIAVQSMGGHGEYVEKIEDLNGALSRAFGAKPPSCVNVRIGSSDFRKDAISV
ncbi:MAG: Acetolactate synthase large subunit IlvG [Myxococcota bacterium]|nr:Acetolactate synthase large subunit IlvG [Myxococcota bacterium]